MEFLESTGSPYIITDLQVTGSMKFELEFLAKTYGGLSALYGVVENAKGSSSSLFYNYNGQLGAGKGRFIYGEIYYYPNFGSGVFQLDKKYHMLVEGTNIWRNGEKARSYTLHSGEVVGAIAEKSFISTLPIALFTSNGWISRSGDKKIYFFRASDKGIRKLNLIPALDSTGRPCMFDTVTRKPFYNQGTGEFIAGMTAKQARHLAYLPATGGSLTVSLPLAAAFDEKVQNALTTASEKNWVFTFYWTEVTEYLTPRIDAIVGAGNYTISYDYTAQKVSLAFTLSVTSEQISEVRTLFDNELLSNLVVEMQYVNGLPVMDDYMPLEYVDCVKNFTHDSTVTTNAPDIELDMMYMYKNGDGSMSSIAVSTNHDNYYGNSLWASFIPSYYTTGLRLVNNASNRDVFPTNSFNAFNVMTGMYQGKVPAVANKRVQYHIHDCGYSIDGTFYLFEPSEIINNINWGKMIVGSSVTKNGNFIRIYRMSVRQNGVLTADLVPCVRTEDGTPGFWCNVYKKFYDQAPVATTDLDWDNDKDNGVYYLTEEEIAALGINETEPPTDPPAESLEEP